MSERASIEAAGPSKRSLRADLLFWALLFLYGSYFAAQLSRNLAAELRFEDALIILRYARNLVDGHGLVFNPGERVMAFSTPLYLLFATVVTWLNRADAPFLLNTVGIVCFLAEAAAACWLAQWGQRNRSFLFTAAPLIALLTLSNLHLSFLYISMEVHLFVALALIACRVGGRDRPIVTGLVLGLLFLVRYDGALLALLIGCQQGWRHRRLPVQLAVVFGLTVSPWVVGAWWYYGTTLATPLAAKAGYASFGPYLQHVWTRHWDSLRRVADWYVDGAGLTSTLAVLLVALTVVGQVRLIRERQWAWVLFPLLQLVIYAAIGADPNFAWHYYTLHTASAISIGLGVGELLRLAFRSAERRNMLPRTSVWPIRQSVSLLLIGALAVPVLRQIETDLSYRYQPDPGTTELRAIAQWIDVHYDDRTSLMNPSIGELGYSTGLVMVDHAGLVTPGLYYWDGRQHTPLLEVLESYRPDLVLLYGTDPQGVLEHGYRLVESFQLSPSYRLYERLGSPSTASPAP